MITANAVETNFAPKQPPLDFVVHEAVSKYLGIPPETVVSMPNSEKYHESDQPGLATLELHEVFSIMRELNQEGVSDGALCTSEHGGPSFRETLTTVIEDIVRHGAGRSVNYLELGPEPVKTGIILETLLAGGMQIESYTGLDINPASEGIIRQSAGRFLPSERIHHVTADYHSFDGLAPTDDDSFTLITMMGFQEGNESPQRMAQMFRRIMNRSDVLLAEMQLLPRANWLAIFDFYSNDLMRRFSKIGLRKMFGEIDSVYGVVLVPVPVDICGTGFVAVTTERIVAEGELKDTVIITNYCLKFTQEDFRRVREFDGGFRILSQRTTGDESVGFQLAERL